MMEQPALETNDQPEKARRDFLKWGTAILTLLCGLVVGIPLIGSFIGPAFRSSKSGWIKIAGIGTLPAGAPVNLRVPDVQVDAYIRESVIRHVWAVRDPAGRVTVFSPSCTHLGCQFNWNPATGHFECPCHGSSYALDGTVLGGPAPRRLDTLPTKVEGGDIFVQWTQYKSGTHEKIPV